MAVADGDNTSASTWAIINSTSFAESEGVTMIVPTAYATNYTTFAPGVITVDGIGIRLANRTGTTGTFSVELYNVSLGASVAGTEITINCSDFKDALTASVDGGWYFFKFTPVLLLAATNYIVRFKTSSATQISVFGISSTNPSRFLRTTTTSAPAAGDDRIVVGEWTAPSTTVTRTVTLDDTGAAVDYGSAAVSVVTPALSIGAGGIVLSELTSATTYVQKISGNVVIYNGGELTLGTTAGRMPTNSSLKWTFDCVGNVDFGIDFRRKSVGNIGGEPKTRWTLLTSDEAASATVIQVVDTSGWKAGDTLLFTGTGTTITHGETKTILTVDSSTQVTLTAGLTNAHTGTGDCIGEVGNLTSNVTIIGTSNTVGTFVCCRESSNINFDNGEFNFLGASTVNKRGVEIQHLNTSVNSLIWNSCSFRNHAAVGLIGCTSGNASFFTITNNVFSSATNGNASLCSISSAATGLFTFTDNLVSSIGVTATVGVICNVITSASSVVSGNRISGASNGITINGVFASELSIFEMSGMKIHSCSNVLSSTTSIKKIFTSCDFVSTNFGLTNFAGSYVISSCKFLGNQTAGIYTLVNSQVQIPYVELNNCEFRGRTGFGQQSGIAMPVAYGAPLILIINSCTFGVTTAHTVADINVSSVQSSKIVLNNCTLSSTTKFNTNVWTFLSEYGSIGVQRLNTTAGNHSSYVRQGAITYDTAIFNTASPSLRIMPHSLTVPCNTSLFSFKVPINSGQACTPSVYVRESETGDGAVYNGNRVKLYVKANYNLGITSDTLLDTATAASDGAFEELTGTTSTVTDAGVLEFYLVCDGSAGWINADDFTATNA